MQETMLEMRAERPGAPAVLSAHERPIPRPQPGQVLIRVTSAAINYSDVMRRRGSAYPFPTPFPYVPGSEVAGTVAALGEGVHGPPVGTPVAALVGQGGEGGYAQYALADAARMMPIPPGVEEEVAASLFVVGATAVLIVDSVAALREGQSIFVPAAAGAVGSFVCQLARHRGAATVIGATSKDRPVPGADAVIDYTAEGWVERVRDITRGGVDVALCMGGGRSVEHALDALAPFGRAIVYGSASGHDHELGREGLQRMLSNPALGQSLHAFNLGAFFGLRPEAAGAALTTAVELVATGVVDVRIDRVLPLTEAAAAHAALENRQSAGKIILKPWRT